MEFIKKELEVPKELNEVATLIVSLVEDIVAKKDLALVAAESLPLLMTAIQGFEAMQEELKDDKVYNVAVLLVSDLVKVLKKKKA